jgi:aconitate hydratase 2/2-methylisocitrate dehydratase
MGNQEKAAKGDTVMATSTRLFKVVEDAEGKRRVFTVFNTSCCFVYDLRKTYYREYKTAVKELI